MKLTELLNGINTIQITGNVRDNKVSRIEYDSRRVTKDSVFVAIKGFRMDGHSFIQDALKNGAIAVVLENDSAVPAELFKHHDALKILVGDSRLSLAEISGFYYGYPASKLNLIGITGTNGKTTTSYLIKNIFDTAELKSGLLGTISNYVGSSVINSKLTTPESNDLNEMLSSMINEKCSYAVMEVSSHSLALKRVYGLNFSTAVFTNLSADHLDFHRTFENYLEAKKTLFDNMNENSFVVYNSDDENSDKILAGCSAPKFSYGTLSNADFHIDNIRYNLDGTEFTIRNNNIEYEITTSLVGEFNAYNACAAFAVCKLNGVSDERIIKGIKSAPQIPGRFEVIRQGDKTVIIDYSHTPDSLVKVLNAIKVLNKEKKEVVTVFGCGGNRDKIKRPEMGKIASTLSDKVIITSDNPRDENPEEIINDIITGIMDKNYSVFENREEAIKEALEQGAHDAIILVSGKGHENYQEIKGKRTHFSDKEIAEKYLHS